MHKKNIAKSIFFVSVLCSFFVGDTQVHASWICGGPHGGYVECMAMAQTNHDIIYAGTVRGVFKSVNMGSDWEKAGLSSISIRSIQVAPNNSDIVYAGTYRDGIYKSEDGGTTWSQKGLNGQSVNTIAVDPDSPNVLYAGTGEGGYDYEGEIISIFKSTDWGETWHEKLPEGQTEITTLLLDTDNPSYIYAGVRPYAGSPWHNRNGLLKSTDGADTWKSIHVSSDGNVSSINSLAMTPKGSNPGVIYAHCPTTRDPGIYKSTNRGEDWILMDTPWTVGELSVDPNNPLVIYFDVFKSIDGGTTWTEKSGGLPPVSLTRIEIDPRNTSILYVGASEGGVYKSTDGADNWKNASQGMNSTYINDLAVHPFSSGRAFATVKGGFPLAGTTNGGSSWNYLDLVDSPIDLDAVAIDPRNPSIIWAGDSYRNDWKFNVYKSTDGGQNWRSIRFGTCSWCWSGVSDILIKADDSNAVLLSMPKHGDVVRTTDGGVSWEVSDPGKSNALADDPNNPNIVYFARSGVAYVYRSTSFGAPFSWTRISPQGSDWGVDAVRDIEVDLNTQVYAATSEGLMKWQGDGIYWTKLNGLPTDDITALAIDRSTSPEVLYAGTATEGVLVSKDGGDSWIPFNEDLGNLTITKLSISDSHPQIIYAGTKYGGAWSRTIINDLEICECDLNQDGSCNGRDWLLFYPDWGRDDCNEPGADPCECDLNGDGSCNGSDWLLFYPNWGRTDCLE